MSVQPGQIKCLEPGCSIAVARGNLVDGIIVWEVKLHESVVSAPQSMHNGQPIDLGDFKATRVIHQVSDGKVQHTIRSN